MKNYLRAGMAVAVLAVWAAASAVSVTAQENKEAVIKARQDFMESQQHAVDAISNFAKGKGTREAAVEGVNKLLDLSTQLGPKLAALFPPGTSNADFPGKTRAKPELWQHLDEAKAAPAKLHEAELQLVPIVKTADPETVGKSLSGLYRQSCNGLCHNAFRAPEEKK
ncbi:MAG TPA: cytochrome c [Stellaceae bacterium]|nr:cytochrome c [Stellaceae bacterium]